MLINPLIKEDNNQNNIKKGTNKDQTIGEIISFLISNYSEYLSEIDNNKKLVENIVREKVYKEYDNLNTESTIKAIMDRLFGYHILQKYIDNKEISDIRVTNFDNIMIKKNGEWSKTNESFGTKEDYTNFVRYCVLKNKGKITSETPVVVVSDRKNNLRIEAGIEPVNVMSPNLVVRIHRPEKLNTLEDLYNENVNMFNKEIYNLLNSLVISGCNVIISGKGGSGKTTLMRNLINKIPQNLSITSNEETAELYSTHPNIIQREVLMNRNADKNITLATLTAHSLVMSNDVIVIGELKGEEAMVFFDAVSTGHIGYATVHSDSSTNTIDRLVTLMKRDVKAQSYTDKYLRKLLALSVDIIIFMKNFKVYEIAEVIFDEEKDDVSYNLLFKFETKKYANGKTVGKFKKVNEPKYKVKEKIKLNKEEIERVISCL